MTRRPASPLAQFPLTRPVVYLAVSIAVWCAAATGSYAASPRVLPAGKVPPDRRLEPLKDLNGYFPFTPSKSAAEWNVRAERVRRQMLVATGLLPMPTKMPLNAVVHGRIDRGDYTVEKAYFESMPGFFVTGNLYRPVGKSGKLPGVLCPHGHWANGRFYEQSVTELKKEIQQGAEQFEEGGRSPLQARCVHLARMGCVVFHYDMIGYADSQQISFEIAHRFAKQRPEMNTVENWGLFSPQAEAHCQSIMGLQTYSSIRALDFLCELPDVDPSRLAVTGASGGGTQTFMVCAVDPRPATCFPAVMVSTAMQGGCTCENSCVLRIDTGNVEFAALFAPKPIAMSAADDWTKEMENKGFPDLLRHYELVGAPNNAMLLNRIEFGHNYNSVSRHAMYHWFNQHLRIGAAEPIAERDYKRSTQAEMTVWDDAHPRPAGGADFERQLLQWWTQDGEQQLDKLKPTDKESYAKYREVVGGALDVVIGRGLPAAADVAHSDQVQHSDRGNYQQILTMLNNQAHGESLPMALLLPQQWNKRVVVWLDGAGKQALFDDAGQPQADVQRLLDKGIAVVGVDLIYQGEFLADGQPLEKTRRVENTREAAAYTFGYNHTVFAQRVHDALSVLSFVKHHETQPQRIDVVGLNGAGAIAAAACAQARETITAAAIDTQGFRFGKVLELHSPDFLPGGAKYGDVPGMLAVGAPQKLWLTGEDGKIPELTGTAYQALGRRDQIISWGGPDDQHRSEAVNWLLAN